MELGFIGLGRMGNRMVTKLVDEGHEVVLWNRTQAKVDEFLASRKPDWKVSKVATVQVLISQLPKPRIVWFMLPAGEATQEILDEAEKHVETGDIIVDGGNAFYKDTQKRFDNFAKRGIKFLGVGVSGGLIAAKEGYPLMVGGDRQAYDQINPILDTLARPNGGHEYFGEGGAGHFVKMIHNGIEYGVMQSIGEGFGVLEKSPYNLDLLKVARLYERGTLLSGFMMRRTVEALEPDPKLESVEGYIEESGEGRWTVEVAKKENLPIEVIEKSVEFREKSRQDDKVASSFAARMVAALRGVFGGHFVRKKQ